MIRRPDLDRLLTPPADGALADRDLEAEIGAVLDAVVDALPPIPPSAGLRSRLLASARAEGGVAQEVARLFDLALGAARALLDRVRDPAAWVAFADGCALMHVEGGPATAGADVGFVRVDDGVTFPPHHHHGAERSFILQGTLVEADGRRYGPGEVCAHPGDTDHSFRAEGSLLFAVVVFGVTFGGDLDRALHPG